MPLITGAYIIDRATDTLQDKDNIRWPRPELLAYINDAQREIALQRPDATAVTTTLELLPEQSRQTLPANGIRLLEVVRNIAADGFSAGRAVKLTAREVLDQQIPNWHMAGPAQSISHFVFDLRNPKVFYVYPRPAPTTSVEIVYSAAPLDLSSEQDVIALDDIYANAIIAYVIMRAYQKDEDYARNADAAGAFYAMMGQSLGLRAQADAAVSPSNMLGKDMSR